MRCAIESRALTNHSAELGDLGAIERRHFALVQRIGSIDLGDSPARRRSAKAAEDCKTFESFLPIVSRGVASSV